MAKEEISAPQDNAKPLNYREQFQVGSVDLLISVSSDSARDGIRLQNLLSAYLRLLRIIFVSNIST